MTTALRQTTALRKRMHQDLQLAGPGSRPVHREGFPKVDDLASRRRAS